MFEEVFGAFMPLFGFDFFALRGWEGVSRWLMYGEVLRCLILLLGSLGWLSGLSGLSGLGVVWQVQESLCSL